MYIYESLESRGYQRFNLSHALKSKYFTNAKWYQRYECYHSANEIRIDVFTNNLGILLETLLIPVKILWHGLGSVPDIIDATKQLYSQKERGSFHSYNLGSSSDVYRNIMDSIEVTL